MSLKRFVPLQIAALLVPVVPLMGQGIQSQLGVAGGVTVPIGEYHSGSLGGFKPGSQVMGLATFRPGAVPVRLRVDVSYGVNNANDQFRTIYQSATGRPVDAKSKLLGVNVDVTYPFPSRSQVRPYVLGGMGSYHATISMTEGTPGLLASADSSETTFAWNLGAGVALGSAVAAVFLEARYMHVAGGLGYSCPLRTSCPRGAGPAPTFFPIIVGLQVGGG